MSLSVTVSQKKDRLFLPDELRQEQVLQLDNLFNQHHTTVFGATLLEKLQKKIGQLETDRPVQYAHCCEKECREVVDTDIITFDGKHFMVDDGLHRRLFQSICVSYYPYYCASSFGF